MRAFAATFLPWALGLWAVGVQVHELPATVGAWATFVLALAAAGERLRLREWVWLLAFVGLALVAPLAAGHLPTGTGVARLFDWLLVPAAAVAVAASSDRALERVGVAAAVALCVSVLLAGLQHVGAWPGPEAAAPLGRLGLGFERVYEAVPGRGDRFMAGGLLLHRLKFANVTAAACVAGAAAVAWRAGRWPLFAVATLVGLGGVAVFPHARAASAAAVGAVAVTWVAAAKDRRRAGLGALALVAGAALLVLAVPSLRLRFASSLSSQGSGERGAITTAGLSAIRSAPLTGVGLDRFRPGLFTPEDAPAQAREHRGKAHNQLVTIAAEAGVPAALLLLVALLGWLRRGLRALPGGALAAGAVALFFLLAALHDPLFHPESSLALMLLLGAGLGALERVPVDRGPSSP